MSSFSWWLGLVATVAATFLVVLIINELGFRAGARLFAVAGPDADKGLGTVEGAVFGLLGLLIAFTFTGAGNRLDVRRELIAQEANAISTSYLRLEVLGPDLSAPLRPLYREYLALRIAESRRRDVLPSDPGSLRATEDLQARIWSGTIHALEERGQPALANPVLGALNAMIDITTSRRMAAMLHPPAIVFVSLFFISALSAFLAGHARGLSGRRSPLHSAIFGLAIAGSIYAILEIEYPRLGALTIDRSDVVLVDLLDAMERDAESQH